MPNEAKTEESLIKLVQDTIERDEALRVKYDVVDKFRFVRERLKGLLDELERDAALASAEVTKKAGVVLQEDETAVYIHLFNSKGTQLKNWKNMVLPNVFYEYSVNRPIYSEKSQIDSFVRSRANKQQHAYLTIAVKKTDVITPSQPIQDAIGGTVIKVKEGALRFEKLINFTFNEQEYQVSEEGEFVKKET